MTVPSNIPMTDDDFQAQARIGAKALGLEPDEASMAAVVAQLKVLRAMAEQFADIPLDEHLDPAVALRL
jgi:hypothetical protein